MVVFSVWILKLQWRNEMFATIKGFAVEKEGVLK